MYKIKIIKTPLFEGYIFVKNESPDSRLLKINNTVGVNSILSFSNKKQILSSWTYDGRPTE